MRNRKYWSKVVSRILKTELTKRGLTYKQLSEKLEELGEHYQHTDLAARVSRGNFGAMLFIQCLRAIGVNNLLLEESYFNDENKME